MKHYVLVVRRNDEHYRFEGPVNHIDHAHGSLRSWIEDIIDWIGIGDEDEFSLVLTYETIEAPKK